MAHGPCTSISDYPGLFAGASKHLNSPIFFEHEKGDKKSGWLVVSTHLENISQIGSFPQGSG